MCRSGDFLQAPKMDWTRNLSPSSEDGAAMATGMITGGGGIVVFARQINYRWVIALFLLFWNLLDFPKWYQNPAVTSWMKSECKHLPHLLDVWAQSASTVHPVSTHTHTHTHTTKNSSPLHLYESNRASRKLQCKPTRVVISRSCSGYYQRFTCVSLLAWLFVAFLRDSLHSCLIGGGA